MAHAIIWLSVTYVGRFNLYYLKIMENGKNTYLIYAFLQEQTRISFTPSHMYQLSKYMWLSCLCLVWLGVLLMVSFLATSHITHSSSSET